MPALTARALQWSAPVLATGVVVLTLWFHLGRDSLSTITAAPATAQAPPDRPAPPALGDIPGWSLFGSASTEASTTVAEPVAPSPTALEDLPPSALGLTVSGIAYSPDATSAHAIIGMPDGRQQQFTPGETLLDGVTVHAIRPLEVIISNQGTLESVPLPLESAQTGGAAPPQPLSMPVIPPIPTTPPGVGSPPVPPGPPGT